MDNWWLATSLQFTYSCFNSCGRFLVKHLITQVVQSPYIINLAHCNFWLFPKLISSLKGKRFQTIGEIQENTTGQLMAIPTKDFVVFSTVEEAQWELWGPKVPALKGTEASLSYAWCPLCLARSSINVSIFHIPWLDDIFWIDLAYISDPSYISITVIYISITIIYHFYI